VSFITGLESWWATTEADVLIAIAKIKSEAVVVEDEVAKAFDWVNNNIGSINSAITQINGVLGTISASGVIKIPAAVGTAIQDANKAVAALNAYQATIAANAQGGVQGQAKALIAGYSAIKQAQNATSIAALAVVNTPTTST
jgi:hypothetical protein